MLEVRVRQTHSRWDTDAQFFLQRLDFSEALACRHVASQQNYNISKFFKSGMQIKSKQTYNPPHPQQTFGY